MYSRGRSTSMSSHLEWRNYLIRNTNLTLGPQPQPQPPWIKASETTCPTSVTSNHSSYPPNRSRKHDGDGDGDDDDNLLNTQILIL